MDEITATQLLADCLRLEAPASLTERLAACSAADWEAVLHQGSRRSLLPLLHLRLRRLPAVPPQLSTEQQALLKRYYLSSLGRNLVLYRRLEAIQAAMAAAHVEVILLKGAHLAKWVYPDLGLRPMGDLDLLVRRADLPAAAAALSGLGYLPARPYQIETELKRHHHLPPYAAEGTIIELHANLASPLSRLAVDVEGLWERAQPLAGLPASGLCPEDLLLHLSLHLQQDEFQAGLRILYDVAQTLERYADGLDYTILAQRAQAWRLQRGLFLALYLAEKLFAARVDPAWLAQLRPADFSAEVAEMGCERALTVRRSDPEVHPDVARLLRERPLGEKARRLWGALLPYPEYVAKKYHLPAGSRRVYLYYAVRWVDMLREYSGQLWKLARRDPRASQQARTENLLNDWVQRHDG